MKTRIIILSSLLCLYGAMPAYSSDCTGGGCYLEPSVIEPIEYQPLTPGIGVEYAQPKARFVYVDPSAQGQAQAYQQYSGNVVAPNVRPQAYEPAQQWVRQPQEKMVAAKSLSIKPVQEDHRPALWDGVHGEYYVHGYDKTVDWRDGVPIWDDSISHYRYKDFSDWFLEASPEIYERDVDALTPQPQQTMYVAQPVAQQPVQYSAVQPIPQSAIPAQSIDPVALYQQNMADAAATRARVEELLNPNKPTMNLWTSDTIETPVVASDIPLEPVPVVTPEPAPANMPETVVFSVPPKPEYVAQDLTVAVQETFGPAPQEITQPITQEGATQIVNYSGIEGCPFQSYTECQIWRRKPIVRETVSPRSSKLRAYNMNPLIHAIDCNKHISANEPVAAPLLDRYKMLMRSAQACCTEGMAYSLKEAGASEGLIYKFLADDANFYGLGSRCLMMTDHDLDTKYPNTATAVVAADVRNGCLCRGRQWFQAMLSPFQQAYDAVPEFKDALFNYTYKDGLGRPVTVSVNNDVQNVLKQLEQCP